MMKRIRIRAGQVGLVFRNGDYARVLTAGNHWLRFGEKVYLYSLAQPFAAPVELELLLADAALANMLEVVAIKDHEIALQFKDGNLYNVLKPGRHVFWKGLIDFSFMIADLSKLEITEAIEPGILASPALHAYVRTVEVESYEKAILFVDGKFNRVLDQGTYRFWKNEIGIRVAKADMRQLQLEVSGQELLTKDKAALRLNFVAQYRVTDVVKALVNNRDFEKQLYVLMQLALREVVGTMTLDELMANKESISAYVLKNMKAVAPQLGTEVSACGVRDIILPGEVRDIMNQVLVAEKRAQANTITRREETASTRSLLNTARLMEDNAMLYKLKEMEYVERIAEKINSITVAGGNQVLDQLSTLFAPGNK